MLIVMKRIFTLLLLVVGLLTSVGASAQADTTGQRVKLTPQERADKLTAIMSQKLLLSADQRQKVAAINLKYAELNQQSKRNVDALKANADARNAEMKAVLNDAQYEKYLAMEDKVKERVKARIRERRAGAAE